MRIFKTLKARLVLVFGLAMLAIGSLTALYLDRVFTEKLRTEKFNDLHSLAVSVATVLSENLRERQREIALLAEALRLQRGPLDAAQLQDVLDRLKQSYPNYAWIGYADADGKVLASTNGLLVNVQVGQRPWFVHGLQGHFIGDLHEATLLSQWLPRPADGGPLRFIDFASPVYDREGRLRGVLAAHAHWRWASDVTGMLRTSKVITDDIQALIMDQDGTLLFPETGGQAPAVVRREGFSTDRWGGRQLHANAVVNVPEPHAGTALQWKVIVRQPLQSMLKEVPLIQRSLLVAMLGAAAVWLVLMVWLASRESRPVEQLSRFAQRIEAGDENAELTSNGLPSEIAQTIESVRKIARVLLERKQALAEANRDLEQKVAERTAALQMQHQHLEPAFVN